MVLSCLAKYFGEEAKEPSNYLEKDWWEEPYIQGAPANIFPPGCFATFGKELRTPFGKLFFGATETAVNDIGYMSGAVEGFLSSCHYFLSP